MYTGGLLVTDGGTGTSQAVLAAADVAIPPSAICEWDFTRRYADDQPAVFPARSVDLNNVVAVRAGAGGRAETAARRQRLRRVRQTVKTVFDRVAAALLLLLFSPVLVGVGLLVRFSSKGPALFLQTRVGRNGRAFRMVKFRSMVVDAESRLDDLAAGNEQDGPLFKMREDPRVTPVGRVLRRFSLDELPQLLNVLSGSMSLVGPRPPLPGEVAHVPRRGVGAAAGQAGHHRPLAGQRAKRPVLGGVGAARPALRELLVAVAGHGRALQDGSRRAAGRRRLLSAGESRNSMRIALVGTRGVPARYGGFETCVEQVGMRLVKAGHDVVVYCRGTDGGERLGEYAGMRLVHLPALRRKSLETLSHTAASVAHLMTHPVDAAIVFNAANAPFVPVLRARGIPVATHVDGLEWKRSKWQGAGRRYYRLAESMAVRWSDALIADAQGIADYYRAEFGADTELIAYGAPIVHDDRPELLARLGSPSRTATTSSSPGSSRRTTST